MPTYRIDRATVIAVLLLCIALLLLPPDSHAQHGRPGESRQLSAARDLVVAKRCHRFTYRSGSPSLGVCRSLVTATHLNGVPRRWAERPALLKLIAHESTWNPNAVNDSSEACGLFQRLVRSGCPWRVSGVGTRHERVHLPAALQAADGLRYILGRYRTPERAWSFWRTHHWY